MAFGARLLEPSHLPSLGLRGVGGSLGVLPRSRQTPRGGQHSCQFVRTRSWQIRQRILKTKRTTDYDDVVRDHLKMIAGRADLSFAFRRDCGRTIEARMQSAAVKN
jgi:hypothetical protein